MKNQAVIGKLILSGSVLALSVAGPQYIYAQEKTEIDNQQENSIEEIEEVVVTAIRRGLESAQGIKRDADQIVDAIVAEGIGKLPDITASESLARVTGVQVAREKGEAGQVQVRGLPHFTTTYNGRDIFTAESRSVALQDFPAGGISAIEVFKTTTANQIAGGIAGLISVRGRKPFEFDGLEIAGSVRGTYNDGIKKADPNGNLLISNRWNTGTSEFGALFNVSYTQLRYLDSVRWNSGGIVTPGENQTDLPNFFFPETVGIFYGRGDRWRPSVNAAFQWRPNDNVEFYADALYQGFRNRVSDRQMSILLRAADARLTNVVVDPNTNKALSLTASGGIPAEPWQGATNGDTDTYQFGVGGIYTSGSLEISVDLAFTDSAFNQSVYSFDTQAKYAPDTVTDINFDVSSSDGGVEFSFRNFDPNNPDNWIYRGLLDRFLEAKGESAQFRTDFKYQTGKSIFREIQAGVRYTDRGATAEEGDRYAFQLRALGFRPVTQMPVDVEVIESGFSDSIIQQTRTWASPTRDSIRGNIEQLRAIAGFTPGRPDADPLKGFGSTEKSYAGWGQVRYVLDTRVPVDGVVGIRVVETQSTISGTQREGDAMNGTFIPRTERRSYTDILPTVSARVSLGEYWQLRLSFYKSRTRPDFKQLNPALIIDPPNSLGERFARGGNIDLDPVESNNYDISLEYYFSHVGSAYIAWFYRDVDGFITNFESVIDDPVIGRLRVQRPENTGKGKLQGVEMAITTFFDFDRMPTWVHNFGAQANFSYVDGKQALPGTLDGQNLRIPSVSKRSYNLIGMYEKGSISARLAYNWRSEWVNFYSDNGQGGALEGEFTKSRSRLDFFISYRPTENVTLTFDVTNILNKPFLSYRNFSDSVRYPRDVRYEIRTASLTVYFRH